MDASSVILLHKADLLSQVQGAFRMCVAASVYAELTRRERPGSRTVARGRDARRIIIRTPPNAPPSHRLPTGLHRGERDTLLCYLDGGADFIIIDDGRGAGYCRREAIPYLNALLCPRVLAAAGRLAPAAARSAMVRIADLGRYSEWVKRYAATCSDAALSAFLP
jgi:hypothetical protein